MHVASSKLYEKELVILNTASFWVNMSPILPLQTFKHKHSFHQGKSCYSELYVAISNIKLLTCISWAIVTPQKIATTQDCKARWNFQNNQKSLLSHTHLKDRANQKFVATILVIYVKLYQNLIWLCKIRFELFDMTFVPCFNAG